MSAPGLLPVYKLWTRAQAKLFTALCRGSFRRLGRRATLQPPLRIEGARHIEIGERVFLGADSWLEVIDPDRGVSATVINIGAGTSVSGHCTISAVRSVIIEPHVLIARYVYIADHTHAHAALDRPIKEQGLAQIAPVRIGEGSWLGQSVVVCPGVTIGRNVVVGANSIVRHDLPDFCVAAGAPARVIRSLRPAIAA
jgi:lipopolysaccharide O-acetyltransferase